MSTSRNRLSFAALPARHVFGTKVQAVQTVCNQSAGSASKVQMVQTACRFLSDLSTHHFSLNINAFNTFSADKSNYGHKMLDARARERALFFIVPLHTSEFDKWQFTCKPSTV